MIYVTSRSGISSAWWALVNNIKQVVPIGDLDYLATVVDSEVIKVILSFHDFYPNVTMLRSGLCYRKSVCLSSVMLVHPTQGVKPFGNISSPLRTLAIPLTFMQKFTEIVPGEPLRRGR